MMLEKIVTALVMALITWLEKKHAESKIAVEGDRDPDALTRIGERVRKWQDGAGSK